MGSAQLEVPFDSITVTLALEPDPVRLAAVVATASRFEARTRGYPRAMRVFREQDLRAAASGDMREFVQWRAGVRRANCGPNRACVRIRGAVAEPRVYVDEVELLAGMEMLASLRPWQIARVEVYNGGAQVRVYTRSFMDWAARTNYQPNPLSLGGR
jgi:outer membrane cobalamin receptor